METEFSPIADAPPSNWVDRWAPESWRPYLRLGRFDRPIGAWLLLFPCWWSQTLAQIAAGETFLNFGYLVLFAIGALSMRAANSSTLGTTVSKETAVCSTNGA